MIIKEDKEIKQKIGESLNLSNFTDEQQDKIIQGLMENIYSAVNIAALDELSEEERIGLEKLLESGNKKEALEYLETKIKDLPLLIERITKEIIDEFKSIRGL